MTNTGQDLVGSEALPFLPVLHVNAWEEFSTSQVVGFGCEVFQEATAVQQKL